MNSRVIDGWKFEKIFRITHHFVTLTCYRLLEFTPREYMNVMAVWIWRWKELYHQHSWYYTSCSNIFRYLCWKFGNRKFRGKRRSIENICSISSINPRIEMVVFLSCMTFCLFEARPQMYLLKKMWSSSASSLPSYSTDDTTNTSSLPLSHALNR